MPHWLLLFQQRDFAKLHQINHELEGIKNKLVMEMRLAMLNSKWGPQEATYVYNKTVCIFTQRCNRFFKYCDLKYCSRIKYQSL